MDPENYMYSLEHFDKHPPGDNRVHYLLANIWAQIASMFSKKPVSYLDIAPWLDYETRNLTPGQRAMKKHIRNNVLQTLVKPSGGTE